MSLSTIRRRFTLAVISVLLLAMLLPLNMLPRTAFAQGSTVNINPSQGTPGTQVTGTGSNWTAGDAILVQWDDGTNLANTTVGSDGTFTVTFNIPSNATQGNHTIYFTDQTASYFIPATFTVTMNAPPTLTVDRVWTGDGNNNTMTTFAPGDVIHYLVQVTNSGSSTVTATFTFLATGPAQIFSLTGNAPVAPGTDGFYSPSTVPTNAPAGTYTLTVTVSYNGNSSSGQSTFTVTSSTPTEPTWALPFQSGTSVSIGPLGLHDHNFGSMSDDRTGTVFTFKNKLAPDSLDIVLEPENTGTATTPTTALASGTVLAVWSACQLVLIDHGNGWWAIYLHMANIQVTSGDTVTTSSIIGYPTTNKPTLKACGSVESTAEHVHIAFLNGSGTTGSYVPMLGQALCGYPVVEQNNDPTNIILQGLTTTKDQVFQVPQCP